MLARLVLAAVLAVSLASAQRGGGGGKGSGGDRGMDMAMGQTNNRLDTIESILKLNKDQKKQVKAVMDDAQKEAAPVREQITASELDMGEAVAAGRSQEEIDKAAGARGALLAQMAGIEMKAFAKIYLALDKEQQPNAGRVFFMMKGIFDGKNWTQEPRP